MKRLILKTANAACVMFAILMACFLAMGYAFAGPSHGLNLAASLYAAAIGITVLQTAWFTDALLKQLSYPARIAGFGVCCLPVLALCAWLGQWIPAEVGMGAWVCFAAIYLVALAIATIGYTAYFKKTVGSYDEALARYRQMRK